MKKIVTGFIASLAASLIYTLPATACTDFQITAKDGTVFIARSMEFGADLKSNLRSAPRGKQFTTTAPNGKPGLSWKASYGYLYLDGMNQDFAVDGLNENGLAFEYLYLPGETQYQTIPDGKENQGISYLQFGDWVLGNFKTVDEVKQALANIFVFSQTVPALGNVIFPLHAAIHDSSGKGIVVEFVNGKMNIHDYMGVMTNSPTYEWQLTNLRNYLNLSPYSPKPLIVNGITYSVTGQGSGMLGLPGDVSPPSRFVKMSVLVKSSYPVANATDALNLAQHIMNNVDIPAGLVRILDNGKESTETTEWVVFKDLTHKVFYYRTYNDMTIRGVSLAKVDFTNNAVALKMPIAGAPFVLDFTNKFLSAK